eukprot:g1380.t1
MDDAYGPLIQMILEKQVKRPRDVGALEYPSPMGTKPPTVAREIAKKFVKEFIPQLWSEIKKDGGKKTMTNMRKKLKSMASAANTDGASKDTNTQKTTSGLVVDPAFAPLVQMILEKKVKRPKDVGALEYPPPMGTKPPTVAREIAKKFVKEFIPQLWSEIKKEGGKKTMTNLRKKLKSIASASASKAVPGPTASSNSLTEMLKKGMTADDILKAKGVSFERRAALRSAFEAMASDPDRGVTQSDLQSIFDSFEICPAREEEMTYLIGCMTGPDAVALPEAISFLNFALFVNEMYDDVDSSLASTFHAFAGEAEDQDANGKVTNYHEMTVDELTQGVKKIGISKFNAESASLILSKGTKIKDFVKEMGGFINSSEAPLQKSKK